MNDIYSEKASCDIAIYGSSRAWIHVNPIILEDSLKLKAYNFGIDGHNFWLQYLRHLEFIKHNNNPSYIILCLDITSLQKKDELYNLYQFLPYMLWNNNIRKYTSPYIGYHKIDYFIPLIRFAGKKEALEVAFNNIIKKEDSPKYRKKGYVGMDREWKSDYDNSVFVPGSYKVKLDPRLVELFERFIKECNNLKIDLILVYPPEYIEWQRVVANRKKVIGIYADFAIKHNIIFLDYSNDEVCLTKSHFFNETHLNKSGSDLFTLKLSVVIEKLNAQKHSRKIGNESSH
jgi:hypothetical protein